MTAITLRPYQAESIQAVKGHFMLGVKRVILCAPTGAGKTVMFSFIVQQTLAKNLDARTLILTDRHELFTQAGGTLANFGLVFEPLQAGKKSNHRARCFVGMVETYYRRLKKAWETVPDEVKEGKHYLVKFNQIIFDEAHKGAFAKLFYLWDEIGYKPYVIGATATPIAAKKDIPLSTFYGALVNRVEIAELVESKYLTPCKTIAAKVDRSGLKTDKGEYSEESQYEAYGKRTVYDGLLQRYKDLCDRYNNGQPLRSICFNINVAHSREVTQLFKDAGYRSAHIDGNTPDEKRKALIDAYKRGEIDILNNVGILNAGFDDAETRCIIFNRAAKSVALWLQSCGRGSRLAKGKDFFYVLDMGSNWRELGLWEAERDWESIWQNAKPKSTEGPAPVKECPQCGALLAASVMACTECDYIYPVKDRKYAEAEDFVEVTPEMMPKVFTDEERTILALNKRDLLPTLDIPTLLKIQELKEYKAGWILFVVNDRAQTEAQFKADIQEISDWKNYKPGWANRQKWIPKVVEEPAEELADISIW